jgi:hypothetical protein
VKWSLLSAVAQVVKQWWKIHVVGTALVIELPPDADVKVTESRRNGLASVTVSWTYDEEPQPWVDMYKAGGDPRAKDRIDTDDVAGVAELVVVRSTGQGTAGGDE